MYIHIQVACVAISVSLSLLFYNCTRIYVYSSKRINQITIVKIESMLNKQVIIFRRFSALKNYLKIGSCAYSGNLDQCSFRKTILGKKRGKYCEATHD